MNPEQTMIKVENLTKRFNNFQAIANLNFEIRPGEFYGFLGPNGAGKTTTIKILNGLMRPTTGRVFIGGVDVRTNPREAKRIVGYIPDRPYLYNKLTGREFLEFVGGLYEMPPQTINKRIDELLHIFNLADFGNTLIESYSHGMRQKLIFASAFLHNPSVIIVDEPMVGLDPRSARLIKDTLTRKVKEEGVTVFMSTHTMSIAEELTSRIGIIQKGALIAEGAISELKKLVKAGDENLETAFLRLTEPEGSAQNKIE